MLCSKVFLLWPTMALSIILHIFGSTLAGSDDTNIRVHTFKQHSDSHLEIHSALENKTHTHLSFSRAWDTCDDLHDYAIDEHDVIHLIWTYGYRDNPAEFQYGKFGQYPAYLLDLEYVPRPIKEASFLAGQSLRPSDSEQDLKVWTITTQHTLTPQDTSYICTIHQAPRLQGKHHVIGFGHRFEPEEARRHVHHVIFYRCTPPQNTDPAEFFGPHLNNSGEQCYFLGQPVGQIPTQYCTEISGGFALGAKIWFLPDDAGLALGESPDEFYTMQIHYDNPDRLSDVKIDVHYDIYYTSTLRKNEAAFLTLGHHIPGSPSILVPPSSKDHHSVSYCGTDCTGTILPPEGITVFAVYLHTHHSGVGIRARHFRGDEELPWLEKDDNYNNQFQPFRLLAREILVKPGDHLTIDCKYDNTWSNGTVVGGFSTRQEMCMAILAYHTKLSGYSLCRSEITSPEYGRTYLGVDNVTWSDEHFDNVATSPPHLAGLGVTQISDNYVNWTPQLREQLQMDQLHLPQTSICSRSPFSSSGQGQIQGTAQAQTYETTHPFLAREYVPQSRRTCGRRSTVGYRDSGQFDGSDQNHRGTFGWGWRFSG